MKRLFFVSAVSIAFSFTSCKQKQEEASTEAKYSDSEINKKYLDIQSKIAQYQKEQWQEVNTLNLSQVNNIGKVFNNFVQKANDIAESTNECKQNNPKYAKVCAPGQFFQNLEAIFGLGFFGVGASFRDAGVLLAQGGKAFIELADFIFVKTIFSGYASLGATGNWAWTQGWSRAEFAVVENMQNWMCNNKNFDKIQCDKSDDFRDKVTSLEKQLKKAKADLAASEKSKGNAGTAAPKKASEPTCNWYKPADGVQQVYMYDHGTTGEGIGAVGSPATASFANSGQYPSSKTRFHVRVVNTKSRMHDATGWINKSQVEVDESRCD